MNPPPLPPPQKPSGNRLVIWLLVPLAILVFAGVGTGIFFVTQRAVKSRLVMQDVRTSASQLEADQKKSYNSKTGITNVNLNGIETMRDKLDSASQQLSGDDALVAKAMAQYLGTMEDAAKKYHAAATDLRAARVLSLKTLSDKTQISTRRQTVQSFQAANVVFENVVSNSESIVRADLAALNVSQTKVNEAMRGFTSKSAERTPLVMKIRRCDDRMCEAMLGILDLLDASWGKWNYDSTLNQVSFEDIQAQTSYNQFVDELDLAQRQQIAAQGQLVSLPQ